CKTGKERFSDAAALLDYGFANISVKELKLPDDMPLELKVDGGMEKTVKLNCDSSSKVVVDKSNNVEIKTSIDLPESVTAPIKENQKLGTLTYSIDGKTVKTCDITAADSVEEVSFGSVFGVLFNSLISL
ncbi:MAG: D-alanyl-D-alanine carboxypeptidase, partial [Ruminococcus sp.]|nr:D-alanyl-D-alanine carboxypeptidase [Ruminococcus sp.]